MNSTKAMCMDSLEFDKTKMSFATQKWIKGSEYVMDAVIGMGEDAYSSGGMAFPIETEKAKIKAKELGINLYAETSG